LTNGLRDAVGQLGGRLPVDRGLPTALVQHLGRTEISTPAAPATYQQSTAIGQYRFSAREFPMRAAQHGKPGSSGHGGSQHGVGGQPLAPRTPGSTPFGPLAVPVMPGSGGSGGGGFAAPAGVGLTANSGCQLFPDLHVVDVCSPATVPAPVMPGKQPGVTPD
jgi:hypothetical protein